MNVVPFKAEHLLALQLQQGQAHAQPFITEDYAHMLEGEYAFTALADGVPIAVGGVTKLWDERGLAWTFVSRNAGAHFVELHKAVKAMLDIVPYRRVEADTPCDFEQGHRWLRMLGFTLEAERMRAFRVDGGDSALYARVRNG